MDLKSMIVVANGLEVVNAMTKEAMTCNDSETASAVDFEQ